MKIIIDTDKKLLITKNLEGEKELPLYSKDSFEIVSDIWSKVGWNEKYSYTFSWMGRPIIQLPEDMIRIQEVIYHLKPDVIIETGIAHGGSLIYYASLCKSLEKGHVVGVDITIKPENRKAIEEHKLYSYITLIEGDSVAEKTINKIQSLINEGQVVLVILDSCHSKQHVAQELAQYHRFVSEESYLVVTDGIMKDLYDVPKGEPGWINDNPVSAVLEFLPLHPEFDLKEPKWLFNESQLNRNITYWPSSWLKRKK